MSVMQESAEMPSTQPIFNPLEKAVIMITDAMRTDYPVFFRQAYPGAEEIRQLKRRLYAMLRGIDVRCIYTGYESCTSAKPNYLPTVPEIIAGTLAAQKEAKRIEKNRNEAAALPPPPKNSKMPDNIRAVWDEIVKSSSNNEADRQERLKTLSVEHDHLLASHRASGAIREARTPKLLCALCGRHGVLSHSTRGDGNWYCPDHFLVSM